MDLTLLGPLNSMRASTVLAFVGGMFFFAFLSGQMKVDDELSFWFFLGLIALPFILSAIGK